MKLGTLLLKDEDMDIDVCINQEYSDFTYVQNGNKLTEYGKEFFKKALSVDIIKTIDNGDYYCDVFVETDEETEDLIRYFLKASAGYISDNTYKKLFHD